MTELEKLYNYLIDNYIQIDWDNSITHFDAVTEFYIKQDPKLMNFIEKHYTDNEIIELVLPIKKTLLSKSKNKLQDPINLIYQKNYIDEIALLENGKLNTWINNFFKSCFNNNPLLSVEENHIRGFCYIYYGFENYSNHLNSKYNNDTDNLKEIYKNIYQKDSQLYKYGLIEVDDKCEFLNTDPPKMYDSKIDKTLRFANLPKELAIFLKNNQSYYQTLSVRCCNPKNKINNGKDTTSVIMEEINFGTPFYINDIDSVPVTMLYSKNYNDCLWIKIDTLNITFEELCNIEQTFDDSIITQVIHLQYTNNNGNLLITHLDHEFVFYTKDEYLLRQNNANIKGDQLQRLKSFKIDSANIPFNFPCRRHINIPINDFKDCKTITETVPFLIFVIKCYFQHTDLIDEYFENCIKDLKL